MKKGSRFEPRFYLISHTDPRYQKETIRYALGHIYGSRSSIKPPKKQLRAFNSLDDKQRRAFFYLSRIRRGQIHRSGKLSFSKRAQDLAIEAVREFGMDAIRLSGPDSQVVKEADERDLRLAYLDAMDHLGALICATIRGWQARAASKKLKSRRRATVHLKDLAAALAPDNRGKIGADRFDVLYFYYTQLFRLHHVNHALRTPNAKRERGGFEARVKAASKNFGLPLNTIMELWRMEFTKDSDKPITIISKPATIKDMARILTDRHFRLTQQTLSNLISGSS